MEENSFDEAESVLKGINQIPILKELRPESDVLNPYLSVHVRPLNQAILCRVKELALSSVCLYHQNKIPSSAILIRALFETVALHYHLLTILKKAIEDNDSKSALTKFYQAGLGKYSSNNTHIEPKAIPIKKFAEDLCRIEPKMENYYDDLSEIVHPNAPGLIFAYAKGNPKNNSFLFEEDFNHIALQAGSILLFSLEFYESNYKEMETVLAQFINFFENR